MLIKPFANAQRLVVLEMFKSADRQSESCRVVNDKVQQHIFGIK